MPRTPERLPHPRYRSDIDGLRAVAVLLVIGFHAFPELCRGGFVGVDVFFVISGFLISTIVFTALGEATFSFGEFYARRIRRIFPALLALFVACCASGWFLLLADELAQLGEHVAAGAGFVSNFVFWHEAGYFDTIAARKPLLHLWSLGIEEQFYIVWPPLLWLAWRRRRVAWVCALVMVASFATDIWLATMDVDASFYLPMCRFWELAAGGSLAQVVLYNPGLIERFEAKSNGLLVRLFGVRLLGSARSPARELAAFAGLLLIGLAAFVVARPRLAPAWSMLLPVGGACLLIAGPHTWLDRNLLSRSFMVWIGAISYPLYLWHWPLLSFARITDTQTPVVAARLVAVGISFGLAWLTYRFVERPIRARQGNAVILAVLMLGAGSMGYEIWRRDGLPSRLHDFERKLSAIKSSHDSTPGCREALPLKQTRYCNLANPKRPPTVALIGDSHANRLYDAMAERYASVGENLLQLGGGGCLPFWSIETGGIGKPSGCAGHMSPQLDFVLQSNSIHTVLLANRGPFYIEGDDPVSRERWVIEDTSEPTLHDAKAIYRRGLRATAAKLKTRGKRVIVLVDQPEFPYDTLGCIPSARPVTSPFSRRPSCVVPRTLVDQRNRNYLAITRAVAGELDLTVVNLQDALCDTTKCWAIEDGVLLYMDADHLDQYGTRYVLRKLWPEFLR